MAKCSANNEHVYIPNVTVSAYSYSIFTSRPFLKNGRRYCFGVRRRLRRPHISVAIKASFLKFDMCKICKNNIAKMFFDFFKIKNCAFDRGFFNFW